MTIQSSWIFPACSRREMHKDEHGDLWMYCKCSNCGCEFSVDVSTTESK